MTVVVKDPKGIIRVMCKGADSILFPLLTKKNRDKESIEIESKTNQFLEDYAKEGLRTLLLVEKVSKDVSLKVSRQCHKKSMMLGMRSSKKPIYQSWEEKRKLTKSL